MNTKRIKPMSIRKNNSKEARKFYALLKAIVKEVSKWPDWMKKPTLAERGQND